MLALMCHVLYLRSRLGQTSVVDLNVVPLFVKRVALDTLCSFDNFTVTTDLLRIAMENIKVQLLVVMAVAVVKVRIRRVHLLYLHVQLFCGIPVSEFEFF